MAGKAMTRAQPWLARAAFGCVIAAVVVLLAFGGPESLLLLLLGGLGAILTVACLYWFLIHRGLLRWTAMTVAALTPIAILIIYIVNGLLLIVLIVAALLLAAVVAGAAALAAGRQSTSMRCRDAAAPQQPYLIMNPRSGGGKVARYGLPGKAEKLGADVNLLDVDHHVDVGGLARTAVQRGADLLGVAGGDGTQALVAGIAAEHDLPFLVLSAGTRNHFALDLGLDRDDPAAGLAALDDGVELIVDLGEANGRTFVNNISFGAYAEVINQPPYRNDKAGTTLNLLPDLLLRKRGAQLCLRVDGQTIEAPQAILISNNPYGTTDLAGLGRRARLDGGILGVAAVSVDNARQAVGLLRRTHEHGLQRFTATEVEIDADEDRIPVGIDGESLMMTTPVRCRIQRQALRVRVPRHRPGVPAQRPRLDWTRLRTLALTWSVRP